MILQALKEYYDRKSRESRDSNSGIAPLGWERKDIHYIISIDSQGNLINVESTLTTKDGKLVANDGNLVPRSVIRRGQKSYETVFFLWDHRGYVLGRPKDDPKSAKQHEAWGKHVTSLREKFPFVVSIVAIDEFNKKLDSYDVDHNPMFRECLKDPINRNITFRVDGDLVLERQDVKDAYTEFLSGSATNEDVVARCLITGKIGKIARLHSATPITKDSKSLVSFQKHSGYDSYGKEQAYNAPISVEAEFAYTTALNMLLGKDSRQKMKVGDATVVFWTSKDSPFENKFADIFDDSWTDDPDRLTNNVAALLSSVKTGAYQEPDDPTRFHVLGLAPSSVRISVRFWQVGTVAEMSTRFAEWFEELMIAHDEWKYRDARDHLPMSALLKAVAPPSRDKQKGPLANLPPNLAGNTMRSILEGLPLPETLLQAALRRIKAEKGEVSYPRAKIIKACLNRKTKFTHSKERMLTVALDKENTNIGYRLGRLFATLERIQCKAMGWDKPGEDGKHSTIRDKYFASASSTPCAVFGTIIRLSNHHLDKIENPKSKTYFNKLIGEITYQDCDKTGIVKFPAHLKLEDQAQFALGYYHQRQDFFSGNGVKAISPESNERQSDLFNQNN